jgi:hypothetical protein
VAHRYWRLRAQGANAVYEASPDRSAWTTVHTVTVPWSLTEVEINIGFGHYATSPVPFTLSLPGVNAD